MMLGVFLFVGVAAAGCRCGSRWFLPRSDEYVGQLRTYDLTAVEIDWDFAPQRFNVFQGRNLTEHEKEYTNQSVYRKCMYVSTDGSLPTHGLLGPTLRALVGDDVRVTLRNNCSIAVSLHVHGFQYERESEGASTGGVLRPGDSVAPGSLFVYNYTVPDSAGPLTADDASTVLWAYHSHVRPTMDESTGLMGAIVVGRPSHCDWRTAVPLDVDDEIMTLWTVVDESQSRLAAVNNVTQFSHDEQHLKHSINGRLFANQPPFETRQGLRARWYLIGFGDERDVHSVHWHAASVVEQHRRVDVVPLFPAVFRVADMVPMVAGRFPIHCHLADHHANGMTAFFNVRANTAASLCAERPAAAATTTVCINDTLMALDCGRGVATDAELDSPLCATPANSVVAVIVGVTLVVSVVVSVALFAILMRRRRRNGESLND